MEPSEILTTKHYIVIISNDHLQLCVQIHVLYERFLKIKALNSISQLNLRKTTSMNIGTFYCDNSVDHFFTVDK